MNLTFFNGAKVRVSTLECIEPVEISRTSAGDVIKGSLGAALWQGTAELVPAYHADARAQGAILSALMRPGQTFMAGDRAYVGPRHDPKGAILTAHLAANPAPTIHTLNADNRRLRIAGLPANYQLAIGDRLAFTYGTNPVRYAFHEVLTDATASSAGLTPLFEVHPNIRAGALVGAEVTLIRPGFKAVIRSGSRGQQNPLISDGMSFDFIQTLR